MKRKSDIKIDRMIKLSDVLSTEVQEAIQVIFLLTLHFIDALTKHCCSKECFYSFSTFHSILQPSAPVLVPSQTLNGCRINWIKEQTEQHKSWFYSSMSHVFLHEALMTCELSCRYNVLQKSVAVGELLCQHRCVYILFWASALSI